MKRRRPTRKQLAALAKGRAAMKRKRGRKRPARKRRRGRAIKGKLTKRDKIAFARGFAAGRAHG